MPSTMLKQRARIIRHALSQRDVILHSIKDSETENQEVASSVGRAQPPEIGHIAARPHEENSNRYKQINGGIRERELDQSLANSSRPIPNYHNTGHRKPCSDS